MLATGGTTPARRRSKYRVTAGGAGGGGRAASGIGLRSARRPCVGAVAVLSGPKPASQTGDEVRGLIDHLAAPHVKDGMPAHKPRSPAEIVDGDDVCVLHLSRGAGGRECAQLSFPRPPRLRDVAALKEEVCPHRAEPVYTM